MGVWCLSATSREGLDEAWCERGGDGMTALMQDLHTGFLNKQLPPSGPAQPRFGPVVVNGNQTISQFPSFTL